MCSFVNFQVIWLSKCFIADIALKWLFSSMNAHMNLFLCFFTEFFVAKFTGKWFFASMSSFVYFQAWWAAKWFLTDTTFISERRSMDWFFIFFSWHFCIWQSDSDLWFGLFRAFLIKYHDFSWKPFYTNEKLFDQMPSKSQAFSWQIWTKAVREGRYEARSNTKLNQNDLRPRSSKYPNVKCFWWKLNWLKDH